MRKYASIALAAALLASAAPVAAQGLGHGFLMKGSIVSSDNSGTVVCLGSVDGAEVGQVFEVYRVVVHPGPSKSVAPIFHRQLVGHVRIDHVFDEHFAHVSVTDGHVAKNDIVELH